MALLAVDEAHSISEWGGEFRRRNARAQCGQVKWWPQKNIIEPQESKILMFYKILSQNGNLNGNIMLIILQLFFVGNDFRAFC